MKQNRIKLAIIFGVEFVAVAVVLLLIFFAGKKSYTVTFDLNGGTLLSGDLVQEIRQGSSATPPTAAKDGCYFHSWSASYKQITKDMTIRAIWEYETTVGIEYSTDRDGYNSNYCEITGSFSELRGDVFIGAYHDGKKALGIRAEAFKDRTGIEHIYMLDGMISVGEAAFAGCTSLESIVLPGTIAVIGDGAFEGCTSLKSVTLPASLEHLGARAFAGCTSLEEIIFLSEEREVERDDEVGEETDRDDNDTEPELPPETYAYAPMAILKSETFAGCTSLERVTLPPNLTEIGPRAFIGCSALESIELPEVLEEIGAGAFSACASLLEVTLPSSVKVIGIGAFDNPLTVINTPIKESERPVGWSIGCFAGEPVWEYVPTEPDTPDGEDGNE